jgi:pilus assembly protein CpaF
VDEEVREMSFGKRTTPTSGENGQARPELQLVLRSDAADHAVDAETQTGAAPITEPEPRLRETDKKFADAKAEIFNGLIDSVDLAELNKLNTDEVREEIQGVVTEIIALRNLVLSSAEQQRMIKEICDEVLGLGPLEPLLARDDIADIMVNGADEIYVETEGRIQLTDVKFRDNDQLMAVCQRIVHAIGRRVDEASPICDARLADGSRVNVIVPPLALDSPILTIRKFTREKLTLERLVEFGTMTAACAQLLQVAAGSRCNILISGGTGSGKTTLLNCLTRFIDAGERVITCEDAAELQLQQPHVVRLETRPPNIEGIGEVTMRDLVRNCLRMRPERIIVGEVRGAEAFDLLQAMNTGHDGSMGTVHANNPRDGLSRIENMVAMANLNLPWASVRRQIASAVNLIVQVQRLRDGSRKVTHVTEVTGMEGEVVTLQDLFVYEILGEDHQGRIRGEHRPTGLRPAFWDRAAYFGLANELAEALEEPDAVRA